ncbi:prephenate dehydrogenase [Radiobacillus kanasensis]|uniref:prephenate dehydrogenase n=1 Tax=Radiobacillus kanasensis TaxID=2844358 RepID=UPI001E3E66F4|nr:prephenate dehydrogenase [Radiobacillus kanasensis]UFT97619.1 prephenate dehydrogenase [Radiobacillus kanasensis]
MTKTVFVVGLGLIGGSLAKSIKGSTVHKVVGYDTNEKSLEYAQMHGIIDDSAKSFEQGVLQADYVILSAPVSITISYMNKMKELKPEKPVLVTDVSSVKSAVMDTANEWTSPDFIFIGGHPMAGSHKRGIQAAKEHLFENAIYVLTPSAKASQQHVGAIKELLAGTKSKFVVLNPKEHDEMTSVVSHFPHLIASSLVHQARTWQHTHSYLPKLAAGGFRDITRIASSNPEMWQDIFFQNRRSMTRLLDDWIKEMSSLKSLLENGDKKTMVSYLEQARDFRDGLEAKEKGAIPAFYDLLVDIRDQTGALLKVVSLLAEEDISITNIEILEIREGITGVLRISFAEQGLQQRSNEILLRNGYETMIQD